MLKKALWCRALSGLVLFLVTLLVFSPGLAGYFIFDDFPVLVNNPDIHIDRLSFAAIWDAAFSFQPGGGTRPLAMATFAVNHGVSGLEPFGYKLTGLVVHAVNAVLVFFLVGQLLRITAAFPKRRRLAAFVVALLWSVHPLQVSSALYVVQRMETLSVLFLLISLLAYIKLRSEQIEQRHGFLWLFISLAAVAAGLLCKETAILLPLFALILELTVFRFSGRYSNWVKTIYCLGAVGALVVFVGYIIPQYASWSEPYPGRSFNTPERLVTQIEVLVLYLQQIVMPLPHSMRFYYDDYSIATGFFSAKTITCFFLLVGLLVLAIYLKKALPLFSIGVLWFFAGHVLTSNVVSLELVFEHRNYFSLLGVILAFCALASRLSIDNKLSVVLASCLILFLGVLGATRAATWGDKLVLALDLTQKNPQSARALHDLGVIYYEMSGGMKNSPFFEFSIRTFQEEAALGNSTILAEQSQIMLLTSIDPEATKVLWQDLRAKLQHRPITPETTMALFALLEQAVNNGIDYQYDLVEAFDILFSRVGLPFYSYLSIADYVLEHLKDEERSLQYFALAIEVEKDNIQLREDILSDLGERGYGNIYVSLRQYIEDNFISKDVINPEHESQSM